MEEPGMEGAGSWQNDVEARVREAIARALEGTAQQILANGAAHRPKEPQAPAAPRPEALDGRPAGLPAEMALDPPSGREGPTREQMLQVIGRHMGEGREHFARDGRPLESPEAVLHAMEEDGFVIVGQRVALPAGYRGD
ncbi:hypothetical protein [Limnochorda pilosa]|uniref:hypothetical protein n=1 Tax=Limnochorda pilosa TaxID=1555112 RepID=UPI0011874BA8|nr:hypothetical protein [Limnochorda pilosa]